MFDCSIKSRVSCDSSLINTGPSLSPRPGGHCGAAPVWTVWFAAGAATNQTRFYSFFAVKMLNIKLMRLCGTNTFEAAGR